MFRSFKDEASLFIEEQLKRTPVSEERVTALTGHLLASTYRFPICRLLAVLCSESGLYCSAPFHTILMAYEASSFSAELRRGFCLQGAASGRVGGTASRDISSIDGVFFASCQRQLTGAQIASVETQLDLMRKFTAAVTSRIEAEAVELEMIGGSLDATGPDVSRDLASRIWLGFYQAFVESCRLLSDLEAPADSTLDSVLATVARRDYLLGVSRAELYPLDRGRAMSDLVRTEDLLRNALDGMPGASALIEKA